MKTTATLEDFQNRESFLIKYLKSQIEKYQEQVSVWSIPEARGKVSAYQDMLFKLTKDDE